MSLRASAKVLNMNTEVEDIDFEPDFDVYDNLPGVGTVVSGAIYLVTHRCNTCGSQMQTMGVGHGIYNCSNCWALRSCNVEMKRSFERLEPVE